MPGPDAGPAMREDSQRFLVGDPMAPPEQPATSATRTGPRRPVQASADAFEPAQQQQRPGVLVAIGIAGMLVIAAVGYATARYMGLVN